MLPRLCTLFAAITIGLVPAADGMAQTNVCEKSSSTDVNSLAALPVTLQTALAQGSPGGKIADVNQPFSSTDVILDDMPVQRFRSARLANDCAIILVERGGGHYQKISIVFERNGDSWAERGRTVTPPQWSR